eukprot:106333_1
MATTLIHFVTIVLLWSSVESMRMLGCFGCKCLPCHSQAPKVHPTPTDTDLVSGFDNCLMSFDSPANYSNSDTIHPLTPRSYMVSELQSQQGGFDIQSLYDKTELSPDN